VLRLPAKPISYVDADECLRLEPRGEVPAASASETDFTLL
jgi:hypothetical protein